MSTKRQDGRYYTSHNPFEHPVFKVWALKANIKRNTVLEPFAGANSIITHLEGLGLISQSVSYDIEPNHPDVKFRDTLKSFPKGFKVCITNPPWLAKNSATRRGLPFPDCKHDDLYKHALELCVNNCEWVAALVPESFLRANVLRQRLAAFVSLRDNLFVDTKHPVGLALFQKEPLSDIAIEVWSGTDYVGNLSYLEDLRPKPCSNGTAVRFNVPCGNLGLFAVDNSTEASIRFCEPEEINNYEIKISSRYATIIQVDGELRIQAWNQYLNRFREDTKDALMTSFRGLRKDGMYRRRMDWNLARGIIHNA